MTKKLKKTYRGLVVLISAMIIALVIVGVICYVFIPRRLTNIVPADNVSEIYYYYDDGTRISLNELQQNELKTDLFEMKYYIDVNPPQKSVPYCWLCIMYGDSSVIRISGQKIIKEKDGKSYFYNIRLLSKRGIYRFCPEGEW